MKNAKLVSDQFPHSPVFKWVIKGIFPLTNINCFHIKEPSEEYNFSNGLILNDILVRKIMCREQEERTKH